MKVRIFKGNGGGVSVIHPAPKSKRKDETEEQWLARVFSKSTPAGAEYEDVDKSVILADRTFRDAWKAKPGGIEVDMPKARKIHMDRIRVDRDKKLAELDITFMRTAEDEDIIKKAEIKEQKQILRDIPQIFDLTVAAIPEELKALWPEELK